MHIKVHMLKFRVIKFKYASDSMAIKIPATVYAFVI